MASFYWLYCYYCFPHCIICSYTQYCMLCVTVVQNCVEIWLCWWNCWWNAPSYFFACMSNLCSQCCKIFLVFFNFFFFCQDLGKEIAFIRQTQYSESFYAVFCCFLFPLQNTKFWYLPGSLHSVMNLVQNLTCWITSSYQVKEN